MKKLTAIALSLLMLLSLCACGASAKSLAALGCSLPWLLRAHTQRRSFRMRRLLKHQPCFARLLDASKALIQHVYF